MKYIDADKLKEILLPSYEEAKKESLSATDAVKWEKVEYIFDFVFHLIDSIQQDETQVDKMLCSQVWWEEQGWIMIPPDTTVEGIESLLKQVRKKLQQEQRETDGDDGKFVKILVRKEFAELFQKLGDEIQAGQSSFVGAMNQQEQPEVDLENEFADFLEKENAYIDDNNKISYYNGSSFDHTCDIYPVARHFYELGLNARKL